MKQEVIMKKIGLFLLSFIFIFLNSCSRDSSNSPEELNNVETRASGRTFNIGSVSSSSLATQTGLTSLCSNLYRQVYPIGGASNLKVQNVGSIGESILKFETEGNNPYYVCCKDASMPGVYEITLKSKINESDFNVLMVRTTQTRNTLTLTPIDADLFLTRGIIQDIVGDLKVRAQRWWPCFENAFLNTDQGQAIMFIGAFGGSIGQAVAASFAEVVALGCFG